MIRKTFKNLKRSKINHLIKNKSKIKRTKNLRILKNKNKIKMIIRKLKREKRLNHHKMIIKKVNKKIINKLTKLMENKNQLNLHKMLMFKVLIKTVNNQQQETLRIVTMKNKQPNKIQNRDQTKMVHKMSQHHKITIKTKDLTHKMKPNHLKTMLQLNKTIMNHNKNKRAPKTMDNNPKSNKPMKITPMKKPLNKLNKHYE